MAAVFVNYRVLDQPGYATLVHQALAAHFGPGQVFLASRSIRAGDDFVDQVFDTLRRCEVLIAVIGSGWRDLLGDPRQDWVQREISDAFSRGIRVIPVLVEDAEVPAEADLPAGIAALARCQHLRLRHYTIENDLAHLVRELTELLLADETRASGAPSSYRLAGGPACELTIVPGDILRCTTADVWANSENTEMRMARPTDFSVSGVIRFWGSRRDGAGQVVDDLISGELDAKVERRPVAPGTVIATGAGELTRSHQVRHVVHVAAVHGEPGAGYRQVGDVGRCVRNVLAVAEELDPLPLGSVLFPLLGTGAARADAVSTAESMVSAAVDHLVDHPGTRLRRIQFLGYNRREHDALTRTFRLLPLVGLH
ncbi:TIR domain-containing protein [Lentzea sp. NPDC055074]